MNRKKWKPRNRYRNDGTEGPERRDAPVPGRLTVAQGDPGEVQRQTESWKFICEKKYC